METNKKLFFFSSCYLFIGYIFLSIFIGEVHPFTRSTMYNSFSKEGCAVFMSDSLGNVLPLKKYFNYDCDKVTHNFFAIKQDKAGYSKKEIGKKLRDQLSHYRYAQLPMGYQIRARIFSLNNNQINYSDSILYE